VRGIEGDFFRIFSQIPGIRGERADLLFSSFNKRKDLTGHIIDARG
jgi:hypothetical protein